MNGRTIRPVLLAVVSGIVVAVTQGLFWPDSVTAHGGGLDSNGCHNDRQRGGYHCHRGPLAGQAFASASEAAVALRARTAPTPKTLPGSTATPPSPALAAGSAATGSQTNGVFDSYNRLTRILTLKDAIGATFQFAIRDDTLIRADERADDYFEINAASLPWKVGQQIVVTWRSSADKQKRVAVSIR
jgi:hypothetical protein